MAESATLVGSDRTEDTSIGIGSLVTVGAGEDVSVAVGVGDIVGVGTAPQATRSKLPKRTTRMFMLSPVPYYTGNT